MLDVLIDTLVDCLKILPFLFVTYLIMEWLEHKTSSKVKEKIKNSKKLGPLYGGILGAAPQCGFSAAASNLYAGRVITLGTLISIYLSTSDEMLPILISEQVSILEILKIIGIKMVIGVIAGFLIDIVIRKHHKQENDTHIHEMCEHEHCQCEKLGIIKSSIKHTLNIIAYIFIISLILNFAIEFIGEDRLSGFIQNTPVIGSLLAGVVGLIPNCAASVVITQLYLNNILGFGAMISGLLVGAGVGLLVLFKTNGNIKENIKIVALLYAIGVICGSAIELIGTLI